MPAYYNEIDPFAAEWLRELIKAGHIAPGDVDQRSIVDVHPDDLRGYAQCHFFAGIGVWSHALRRAGWPDDLQVWTGSCPCQPFSAAGKGAGFSDPRHLWPDFFRLIESHRPVAVFGEQVASKDGLAWLDLVAADLEGAGYAFGAVDTCAAGFGAPHIRQRLYWVAEPNDLRLGGGWVKDRSAAKGGRVEETERGVILLNPPARRSPGGLADAQRGQRGQGRICGPGGPGAPHGWASPAESSGNGVPRGLDDAQRDGRRKGRDDHAGDERKLAHADGFTGRPSPTDGHWRDADWLLCRDGKWRPVEPGSFPLAHGAAARVGRLRGYGNAIVAPQAQAFIEAYLSLTPTNHWSI